jgi:hypothetical protein
MSVVSTGAAAIAAASDGRPGSKEPTTRTMLWEEAGRRLVCVRVNSHISIDDARRRCWRVSWWQCGGAVHALVSAMETYGLWFE